MVDGQGRVLGRLNLVDALVLVLLLGVIPLSYGAYLLFKAPPPAIYSVEPTTLQAGPNLRVKIRGEHLRPYMRVSFNDQQGVTFLFQSPNYAEVDLPGLLPGVYDVVLYDYAQERARLPKALTITAAPLSSTWMNVAGVIRNMFKDTAAKVVKGMELPGWGTVLEAGAPRPSLIQANVGNGTVEVPAGELFDVPVLARIGCYPSIREGLPVCLAGTGPLAPGHVLEVRLGDGTVPLYIDQVRSALDPAIVQVVVRFTGTSEALAMMRPGDKDVGAVTNPFAAGAVIERVGGETRRGAETTRDVVLQVPVHHGVAGWRYVSQDLRVGAGFEFRTRTYELRGTAVQVSPPAAGNVHGFQ